MVDDEPEVFLVRFPDDPEWRLERDRQAAQARRRVAGRVECALVGLGLAVAEAPAWSEQLVGQLFEPETVDGRDPCSCSCHPQLPTTDLHDYGDGCSCRQTAAERREGMRRWQAEMDAIQRSPQGVAEQARREAERAAVHDWVGAQPDVEISRFGGMCPEQWEGSVAGHSFYFRERHDMWRIELDLRPTGRTVEVLSGSDGATGHRELEEGEVIAEGVTDDGWYDASPLDRARFLVTTIREHLGRGTCTVHRDRLAAVTAALGSRPSWCPSCGTRLE